MHQGRLFVLWVMMFAVPFQGYAAASMVFCGVGHADAVTKMSARLPGGRDHVQHQHAEGRVDHHHASAQDVKQPAKDSAGDTASAEFDAMHKCGTCGACHATALTNKLELAVFYDLPRADLAEPAITVATPVPDVLDKPPPA